jgi:two-component system phosphate regulon sensor histidine kinase PhoR
VTLTQRVLAGSLAIVAVLVVVVVTVADRRLERSLMADAVEDLAREARLVSTQWRVGVNPDSLADATGRSLQRRVTLIDSSGRVIGDTEFDPPALYQLQNHSGRPEVIDARRTGMGWSRRSSPSEGDEELYVAVSAPLGVSRVSMNTRALSDIIGSAQRDVLFGAALAALVAIALTVLFARRVSRPILALRDVARDLAAGNLGRRPQLSASGEIGDLADALRRMAEQLEARLNAMEADDVLMTVMIESLNEGVVAVSPVGDVVRANASARGLLALSGELPMASTQLPRDRRLRETITAALAGTAIEPVESEIAGRTLAITARPLRGGGAVIALLDLTPFRQLEHVRRDFVANVSHELRTPLTVISGFAETLEADALSDEHRSFAEMIRSNAQRMRAIVDDLLDLSRIESGGWLPHPESVQVEPVAQEAVDPLRVAARQRDVAVEIDFAAAPTVWADPMAVRQVLTNLVSNAIRHTTKGTVTLFSNAGPKGVAIGVRDTGTGIAPVHLSRIFERFYRVDPGRARDTGGTGLGLAIVRHLAEAHGGHAYAESVVGAGTTVVVVFPNRRASPGDA